MTFVNSDRSGVKSIVPFMALLSVENPIFASVLYLEIVIVWKFYKLKTPKPRNLKLSSSHEKYGTPFTSKKSNDTQLTDVKLLYIFSKTNIKRVKDRWFLGGTPSTVYTLIDWVTKRIRTTCKRKHKTTNLK